MVGSPWINDSGTRWILSKTLSAKDKVLPESTKEQVPVAPRFSNVPKKFLSFLTPSLCNSVHSWGLPSLSSCVWDTWACLFDDPPLMDQFLLLWYCCGLPWSFQHFSLVCQGFLQYLRHRKSLLMALDRSNWPFSPPGYWSGVIIFKFAFFVIKVELSVPGVLIITPRLPSSALIRATVSSNERSPFHNICTRTANSIYSPTRKS